MRSLIIYDSQFGNTERIAHAIADALRAFGSAQVIRVDPARPIALQEVDLLLVGSPTQGFRPTATIQSFLINLSSQSLSGLTFACFDTRFQGALWKSSAAPRMVKQLRSLGGEPMAPAESFFVKAMKKEGPLLPGEMERAASWAEGIHQQYEVRKGYRATVAAGGDRS